MDVQLFHHHLLKKLFFLTELPFTFVRYQSSIYVQSISGFSVLFPLSEAIFMLILNCVDYYHFILNLEISSASCPNLFFFFKCVLSILIFFSFACEFQNQIVDLHKIACWDFDLIVSNLKIYFERISILTTLSLLFHENGISLHLFRYPLISLKNILQFSVQKSFTFLSDLSLRRS